MFASSSAYLSVLGNPDLLKDMRPYMDLITLGRLSCACKDTHNAVEIELKAVAPIQYLSRMVISLKKDIIGLCQMAFMLTKASESKELTDSQIDTTIGYMVRTAHQYVTRDVRHLFSSGPIHALDGYQCNSAYNFCYPEGLALQLSNGNVKRWFKIRELLTLPLFPTTLDDMRNTMLLAATSKYTDIIREICTKAASKVLFFLGELLMFPNFARLDNVIEVFQIIHETGWHSMESGSKRLHLLLSEGLSRKKYDFVKYIIDEYYGDKLIGISAYQLYDMNFDLKRAPTEIITCLHAKASNTPGLVDALEKIAERWDHEYLEALFVWWR